MAVRRTQRALSAGVVSEALHGRTDLEKFGSGLSDALNVIFLREGGGVGWAGSKFIGEVANSNKLTRLHKFQFGVSQIYVNEWGDNTMRVTMGGAHVLETAKAITALSDASPGVVGINAHGFVDGNQVFVDGIVTPADLAAALNGRYFRVANKTANTFQLVDMFGDAINTTPFGAWTAGGTVARVYQLATPYGEATVPGLCMAQSNDHQYVANIDVAPHKLTRSGHAAWAINPIAFQAAMPAPTSPAAVATTGSGAVTYKYKVTAHDDDILEESLPSAEATCTNDLDVDPNKNTITAVASPGADRYSFYKDDNGIFGYIGGSTVPSFVDDNIDPDLAFTPPTARNPFSGVGDYPGVVEFHGGRLVWGCTLNDPGLVLFSGSDKYENMNVSQPARSDDALTLRLRPGVNPVRGFSSGKTLAVFTADAEWSIGGSSVVGFITPASVETKMETYYGAQALKPLKLADGITLFVQRQGRVVRAHGYSFEKDGMRSNDLTLLAPDLFRGRRIVAWDYQQDPNSIVWCVMSDGEMLTLTFVPDQNVFAWGPGRVPGVYAGGRAKVLDVVCTEGEDEDEVTLLVQRTIGGQTKQYMEQLYSLNWGTDIRDYKGLHCAIEYNGAPTNKVYGAHHLKGQTVAAFADGWLLEGLEVAADGSVQLDPDPTIKFSKVLIGLQPEAPYVVPLPVSEETGRGASEGRMIRVTGVVLSTLRTLGLSVGPTEDKILPVRRQPQADWSKPPEPVTGLSDLIKLLPAWSKEGVFKIRGTGGLPFHLRGIFPDTTVVK